MNKQKIFNFKFAKNDTNLNFYINNTNNLAYEGVLKKNHNFVFLIGPKKSGKSFLAKIWMKENNSILLNNNFEFIINNRFNVLIDNFQYINKEENIFHILNHCKLYNLKVLIVSNYKIDDIKFKLEDLVSRLKEFYIFQINKPDDDMLLNILTKLFVDKQFVVNSHDIFEFILKRCNRSYESMFKIVNKLDKLSLEKKRQLTIPLIKEIL